MIILMLREILFLSIKLSTAFSLALESRYSGFYLTKMFVMMQGFAFTFLCGMLTWMLISRKFPPSEP